MAIQTSNNTSNVPAFNIAYSATIGRLFVRDERTEAAIGRIKTAVGDVEWKRGFQGKDSQAVKLAKDEKLDDIAITGVLTSVYIRETDPAKGPVVRYLQVGMKDDEGRYYLSIDINSEAGQKLARKLVNAKVGEHTVIKCFATLDEPKPGETRAYASHGATVKQGPADGELAEVKGADPTSIQSLVEEALKKLADAGVDDKETISKRRQKVTADWHVELVAKKAEEIKAHYDTKKAAGATDADDHEPAPAGGEDDPYAF